MLRDLQRRKAQRKARIAALEHVPQMQIASDAALALVLAASLLLLGCRPTPPGEQDPGPLPDPDVSAAQQRSGGEEAQTGRLTLPAAAQAQADLLAVPGQEVRGVVQFTETQAGVRVQAQVSGLEQGAHGFHVHETGDCSDPGTTAGDHFSAQNSPHGPPDAPPAERHAGDLGNLMADEHGHAELELDVRELEIRGEHGIADRAVIVHAGRDDLATQPDGDAGDPIACGIIREVEGEEHSV